ncbi:hypothetical protein CONPUDRAFT_93307 [Coniophora puteana RWD-64-598 SS2]|uniref:Six-hairpin glycosidase n=1 Tax=Coniophora puteana (strain RWD-64-598) TaxID=741705 RepID=A0A5M3MA33_CONPW|nr:uncharacterized protein CONPUDRAFT_93307 [Coniophora puteana RWD-64-598 SS2]EIW75495.1 hypothetical protein CONPUDRAFT_93307 [Coniophora puteana RWD-64-598 SS2]
MVTMVIDRQTIVSSFNPTRNASSPSTPLQVGNGNFAFGADITGLQTFLPWAILSSWAWKNDTLPPGRTLEEAAAYTGKQWWNHDRLVTYKFGGDDPELEQWLIANPNRVNLGRVGLVFFGEDGMAENVTEVDMQEKTQVLDLWSGTLTSTFIWNGANVTVRTSAGQDMSVIGVSIDSSLFERGQLGVFLDFPWCDGSQKFEAPFVGYFNMTVMHTTNLTVLGEGEGVQAQIEHTMVNNTFFASVGGDAFSITRDSPDAHRYTLRPSALQSSPFSFTVGYSLSGNDSLPSAETIFADSADVWDAYWEQGGFVDLTSTQDSRAQELQRRIILSRYLMRVNEAGDYPSQESGLVNNGWVQQGWPAGGARWGKMSSPSGSSAPGEINELLIWQQPHPLVFAEYFYRAASASPSPVTAQQQILQDWLPVVNATANWMADFAWPNASTHVYDLGPPMYTVAEDTAPNGTVNPAFELAYWRFGLDLASAWLERLGELAPELWTAVQDGLAEYPVDEEDGLYAVYEGIPDDFWTNPMFINDHPATVGMYGWLPAVQGVNISRVNETAHMVWESWNITNLWGWDFPLLALNAARSGEASDAVDWLLHPLFQFDDAGYPIGGVRVPTPYFPGSGALLYAIGLMAGGWDADAYGGPGGGEGAGFPEDWVVRVEGIMRAL